MANEPCDAIVGVPGGELYVVKPTLPPHAPVGSDVLFDTLAKGEPRVHPLVKLELDRGAWMVGDIWRLPQGLEVAFLAITLPDGWIDLDSSDGTTVDWGAMSLQRLGNSLPVGKDAGIGLVIPGDRSSYPVSSGAVSGSFPQRLPDGGVVLAFAPLAEVNPSTWRTNACDVAGRQPDTSVTLPPDEEHVLGRIIGYNVHRLPACAATSGTSEEFGTALGDASARTGSLAFIDLRTFVLDVPNDGSVSPGPNDLEPLDGVDLVNPDGRMYSGDEVVLFTDRSGVAGANPARAPRADQDYWYAVQPVWRGSVEDFASAGFTLNEHFFGDHRRDLDGDGTFDAVDLHLGTTTPEFISPQAEPENGGHDGLGLTHAGRPFVGPAMYAPRAATPPSFRRLSECFRGVPRMPPASAAAALGSARQSARSLTSRPPGGGRAGPRRLSACRSSDPSRRAGRRRGS